MSYWPPPPERMSVTISSDEPRVLRVHGAAGLFWNGFTH